MTEQMALTIDLEEVKREIEARVPSFLEYTVIDDPFISPYVTFRFADFYLKMLIVQLDGSIDGFLMHLDDVALRFAKKLPPDICKIWDYLMAGETDAKVYRFDARAAGMYSVELDAGPNEESRTVDLVYFPLRGGGMYAAYVDDLNIMVIYD